MIFHIVCPVWNTSYVNLFMDDVLPFYFTEGNLLAYKKNHVDFSFHFYTLTSDIEIIRSKKSYLLLESTMPVFIHIINIDINSPKLIILTKMYEASCQNAFTQKATIITLQPDAIYPDNSLSQLINLRKKGYKVAVAYGFPVNTETFITQINNDGVLNSGRKFTRTCIEHIHDEGKQHYWNEETFSLGVDFILCPIESQQGYLVRAFRLHPIMIEPTDPSIKIYWTPDLEYIQRVCPDYSKIYIYDDSDQMLIASLQWKNQQRFIRSDGVIATRDYISKWIHYATDSFHRKLFKINIFVHSDEINYLWDKSIDETENIVNDILKRSQLRENHFNYIINLSLVSDKKIAIYGAGAFGQMIANAFILNDVIPDVFFDSDENKWGENTRMIKVIEPAKEILSKYFIVVASNYYLEITDFLEINDLKLSFDYVVVDPEWIYSKDYC